MSEYAFEHSNRPPSKLKTQVIDTHSDICGTTLRKKQVDVNLLLKYRYYYDYLSKLYYRFCYVV